MVTSKIRGPWGPAITQRNKVTCCGCLNNAVPVDLISEAPPFPPPCVTLVPTSHFTFPVQLFVQLGSKSATVSIFYFWRISFHGPDLEHGHRNSHLAERRGWSRAARGSEGQGCQMHLTAEDKNSEEALSKGAFRGKMGLIIPKEVLETTATQMLGGPELNSRKSVAIYATWKLELCCVGECLSPYQYHPSSPLRSLHFVSETLPGLHWRLQRCNLFLSSCVCPQLV